MPIPCGQELSCLLNRIVQIAPFWILADFVIVPSPR
jgi:hypothetical protein